MLESERPSREEFTAFVREMEPRLRFALAGAGRSEVVRDAVQDALIYAWEHWDRMKSLRNPGGYLFRVAKHRTWRYRWLRQLPAEVEVDGPPMVEPQLAVALDGLSVMQRRVVYLVEGLGFSQRETAEWLGIRRSSVRTHLERAMRHLRREMGVQVDV